MSSPGSRPSRERIIVTARTKWKHPELGDYYERIGRKQLVPLWERLRMLLTAEPSVPSVPHLWDFEALRPLLLEAAGLIEAEEAERRVLVLENPGLPGRSAATDSLFAGLQLLMPGETAPSHRHSPAALRFIVEGRGAYTAVDGEKAYMEPGDFIVTASWSWHDHGHEGEEPVVWMDVLDLPVVRSIGPIFAEHLDEKRLPERTAPNDSTYRYGMNMVPIDHRKRSTASPLLRYSYSRAREALDRLKGHSEWDACHGLKMEYIDPTTGKPAVTSISTFIQLLPKGFGSERYRTTEGTIFFVSEGRGQVKVGSGAAARTFRFKPKDIFVVPCWHAYALEAEEETVLFSASDRAIQVQLQIWREQRGG